MRNEATAFLLLACMGLHIPVRAESTADELSRIEAETAVLKARARKVEVQAQITAKQAEIANRQADIRRVAQAPSGADPVVSAIEGVGSTVFATLQFPGGREVEVKTGDMLSNGSTVASVTAGEVILQRPDKRRVRLARGGHALAPAATAFPGTLPMPGMPRAPALPGAAE